mmetsp:Transcript_87119/g.154178  ORF Transcript_87119/g.154178 Transcript_87119/m.154178 type:complete len:339 (+) Transcript_87119:51-1067(+)
MEQETFIYRGKEQIVWTPLQLESMGKGALRQRALDIRDAVGDSMALPTMPRSEGLPGWIMAVQAAMMGNQGQGYGYQAQARGREDDFYARPASEAGSQMSRSAPWDRRQLESMGKNALKQRAMNLRDLASPIMDLPPMPRHPDLLPGWIMEVQSAIAEEEEGAFNPPPRQESRSGGENYPPPERFAYQDNYMDPAPAPEDPRYMDRYEEVSNPGTYVSQAPPSFWTEKQLESMSRGALKTRARDLRDRCGADCPPMPGHPDLLPRWILAVQAAMQNDWRSDAGGHFSQAPSRMPSGSFQPSAPLANGRHARGQDDLEDEVIPAAAHFRQRNMASSVFG